MTTDIDAKVEFQRSTSLPENNPEMLRSTREVKSTPYLSPVQDSSFRISKPIKFAEPPNEALLSASRSSKDLLGSVVRATSLENRFKYLDTTPDVIHLSDAVIKLKPYFTPELSNWSRFGVLCCSILLIPAASGSPFLFLSQNEETNSLKSIMLATGISVFINLSQDSLNTFLSLSTSMAIYKDNVSKLMAQPNFLVHGNTENISSLQYVTIGRAVGDFTHSVIPVLIGIPMGITTTLTTLAYIYFNTQDYSVLPIMGFVIGSVAVTSVLGACYANYAKYNLETSNKLVGTVNSVESYSKSIIQMGALKQEYNDALEQINYMTNTVSKLVAIYSSYSLLVYASPIIANNFLGGFYPAKSGIHATAINILITSLVNTAQKITISLTAEYPSIEINLRELLNFDKAYKKCLENSERFEGAKINFDKNLDKFFLKNFCVFVLGSDLSKKFVIDSLDLDLIPNKVYKLSAKSGAGKTLFLNAITQSWSYSEGEANLPCAKNKMYFIPKDPFIPQKTLLEIITYPLKVQEYLEEHLKIYHDAGIFKSKDQVKEELIRNTNELFKEFNLRSVQDKLEDLEATKIDWNQRFSGGERQKIGIIRALLTQPTFIIMDEATNAIDFDSKIKIFNKIKDILSNLPCWYLIYTEHDTKTEVFAEYSLNLNELSIHVEEMNIVDLEQGPKDEIL